MSHTDTQLSTLPSRWLVALIWVVRLAVGAVFIISGLSKAIDLWGFIFKIEEYTTVWGMVCWRSLSFIAAFGLAATEFLVGCMLLIGAFRKSVTWWAFAIMTFMLPLSLYIFVKNPVADCGCFGDFWIISNGATFAKNVVLMAAVLFLLKYNRLAPTLYAPAIQWIPLVVCMVYILIVGMIGYNVQPLVDFRSFPIGSHLLPEEDDEIDVPTLLVYERDGVQKEFQLDELPDSTWTFIETRHPATKGAREKTDFAIISDATDIAPDIIATDGEQMLIVIPELNRADISLTPLINEISEKVTARDGEVIALVAGGESELEYWRDISLSRYELYSAEPTMLKELARGNVSIVGLQDEIVQYKRSASSLSFDNSPDGAPQGWMAYPIKEGPYTLKILTGAVVALLLLIGIPEWIGRLVGYMHRLRKRKQSKSISK